MIGCRRDSRHRRQPPNADYENKKDHTDDRQSNGQTLPSAEMFGRGAC